MKKSTIFIHNLSPIGKKLGIIGSLRQSGWGITKKESINSWVEIFVIGKYNEENM
ncbi:homeobox-containing protein,putative [Methanothermobacter sp. MT-2]|nr:homeobox-containing protein,putative [Methanothermobacter sp. MT-2]